MKKVLNVKLQKRFDELLGENLTKSKCFSKLFEEGFTVGDISFSTQNHYSFVYGAIDREVGIERKPIESKSDIIRKLFDEGMTVGQIAKELNSNYSFTHSVIKKHKQSKIS